MFDNRTDLTLRLRLLITRTSCGGKASLSKLLRMWHRVFRIEASWLSFAAESAEIKFSCVFKAHNLDVLGLQVRIDQL